jgi:hypothetical protein
LVANVYDCPNPRAIRTVNGGGAITVSK